MDSLLHIRVGKEIKKKMQELIDMGMFSNQAEIAREGIRDLLLKYKNYQGKK
jgi:Arc/MetJ-type ribon-helix-helix transcriptional regulator